VSDPYEEPEHAELVVHTENESPEESAQKVIAFVEEKIGVTA
jgi:adenylylsulfate kinase-like enzyme